MADKPVVTLPKETNMKSLESSSDETNTKSFDSSSEEEQEGTFTCIDNGKNYGPVIASSSLVAANKLFTLISKNKRKPPS